tara:strand:+ start:52 stop:228 length:177 start_codon:yes stop_codon:yes gene_type:complete
MSNEYLECQEPSPEEILDSDSSYQKMQDEIDRHWWKKQDREAENKSLQKYNDFLKERL